MAYLLLAIGIVMALGGTRAAMSGWDIVLVERGWALMIAGSVVATGGMIVAALGLVLIDLRRALPRTETAASGLTARLRLPGRRPAQTAPALATAPATVSPDPLPAMAAAAAAGASVLVSPAAGEPEPVVAESAMESDASARDEGKAVVEPAPEATKDEAVSATREFATSEAAMPEADRVDAADAVIPVSDEDLGIGRPSGLEASALLRPKAAVPESVSAPEPAMPATGEPETGGDTAAIEPVPDATRAEPEMPEPSLAEQAPKEPAISIPTVVKTYTAGGHSYIMFSDGTIEADTPEGLFTFQSIEELKAFIAQKAGAAGAGAAEKV